VAASPGCGQSCICPFTNQVTLKLGQRGKDMEDQLATRGRGIELFLQTSETDST
jgi:hypothetical protein